MSGSYFSNDYHHLENIIDDIERLVVDTKKEYQFGPKVSIKMVETLKTLRKAATMVHRLDYLLCGDDGEENFLRRWKEDMAKLKGDLADEI